MKAIGILLYRDHKQEDWSVEIDGKRFDHVSSSTVDDFVEYALVAAQQRLLEPK